MSLLIKAGIGKLSELAIDVDKNWQVRGITNLKEVASSMHKGDLPVRSDFVLVRLVPGPAGTILTSAGPGNIPAWMPAPGPLEVWVPEWIYVSFATAIENVSRSHSQNGPMASGHSEAYVDAPAEMIRMLTPTIALSDSEIAGITPDQTHSEDTPITRQYELDIVVGGSVADDGGIQASETAAAQNLTANDMALLPAVPAVNDAYYFGHANQFDLVKLNLGTQGVGVWTITWDYWNGVAWAALPDTNDDTNGFTAIAGWHDVSFTRPGDWATTTVLGMNLYWIRARVSAYTSITTQPMGTQSKVGIIG